MKVMCIKNFHKGKPYNDGETFIPTTKRYSVTNGNIYETLSEKNNSYLIHNDNEQIIVINKSCFITIEKWREKQLEKLGI